MREAYHHIGALPNNFEKTLSPMTLATQAVRSFKDEYLLDLVNLDNVDARYGYETDERVFYERETTERNWSLSDIKVVASRSCRRLGARRETLGARRKGMRRETLDASHVSRLASKTPRVSRLTSHVRSAPAAAWPKVKLGEVCASISDGDHLPPPKCESGVPFVTISDIKNNRFDLANTRFVPKAYFDAIDEKRRIRKGDVLYSVVGSYGIPVYADKDMDIAFQRHIAILKPGKDHPYPGFSGIRVLRWACGVL